MTCSWVWVAPDGLYSFVYSPQQNLFTPHHKYPCASANSFVMKCAQEDKTSKEESKSLNITNNTGNWFVDAGHISDNCIENISDIFLWYNMHKVVYHNSFNIVWKITYFKFSPECKFVSMKPKTIHLGAETAITQDPCKSPTLHGPCAAPQWTVACINPVAFIALNDLCVYQVSRNCICYIPNEAQWFEI